MTALPVPIISRVAHWISLVKFSHSIFALPFALGSGVVALQRAPASPAQWAWLILAIVAARTAAMTFNRLIDRQIDSRNPRTRTREIPAGLISARAAGVGVLVSSALFFLASGLLGMHCLVLAPFVLGWLLFYSYAKRWTTFAHLILGVALALAPGGVWYAITAEVAWLPVILMIVVALWVAGFDILYSCQDAAFDRAEGLFSIPARYGIPRALELARGLHLGAALGLFWFGYSAALGLPYYLGMIVFAGLLVSQHRLVSAQDLSRINAAFFTRNGLASIVFFASVLADKLW